MSDEVVDAFHQLYYDNLDRTWRNTYYKGRAILKCPLDLWIYHEIIWDVQPEIVVETGTAHGGSALWLADQVGEVITIDVENPEYFPTRPKDDPRITYINTSSVDPETVAHVQERTDGRPTLVILDSDHSRAHVTKELDCYASMVSVGSYCIVEDGNIHGHPVLPTGAPGPFEAVEAWLPDHPEYEVDLAREKFYLTFNPHGYLRRFA